MAAENQPRSNKQQIRFLCFGQGGGGRERRKNNSKANKATEKQPKRKAGLAGGAGGEFDNLDARCVDLLVREARVGESLPGGFHGLEMAQFVEE